MMTHDADTRPKHRARTVMVGLIVAAFGAATLWFLSGLLLDRQTDVGWQRGDGSDASAE